MMKTEPEATLLTTPAFAEDLARLAAERRLYAAIDASDVPAVPEKSDELGKHRAVCLYTGADEARLKAAAPYLFQVDAAVLEWIATALAADPAWGIFAVGDINLEGLRRHFRRFLLVLSPAGQKMNFRFYDPRVLSTYLDCCTAPELDELFGPLDEYGVPTGDGPGVLLFRRRAARPARRRDDILLKMRPAQMKAFARASEDRFADRLVNFLQVQFPDAGTLPRGQLKMAVVEQVARARGHGLTTERQLATYVTAAWLLGPHFDEEMPAVRAELGSPFRSSEDKATWLAQWTEKLFRTLEET